MTKTYTLGIGGRSVNALFGTLTRLGLGAKYRHILTVRGRKTGKPRSTPVDVMEVDGDLWLVAPYGEVNWVRNVRSAGAVDLARGRSSEHYGIEEASPEQSIPVIREYIRRVPVTRSYWACDADAPDDEVAAQIPAHPVFRLTKVAARESGPTA